MNFKNRHNDYELLCNLKKGDTNAFVALYDKFHSPLYSYIHYFIKSVSESEDILQDVFIKIWEIRERINPEGAIEAYFYKIARNAVYKALKETAKQKKLQEEVAYMDAVPENQDDVQAWGNYQNILSSAIEKLPPQRKKIFTLCKLNKKSYEEVALELGISRYTVKEHMVLAFKFIKKQMEENKHSLEIQLFLLFIMLF